jgi:subtilisin family serine protease
VTDATSANHVYVTDFSSRQLSGQQLDVLAPGSWVRGPLEESQGHAQLPWYSKGKADLVGPSLNNFLYVGGTSMASPHVASLAALMLEKNPRLTQAQVESTLKSTALRIGAGSRQVWDPFAVDANGNSDPSFVTVKWGKDAAGSGLVQANLALSATR